MRTHPASSKPNHTPAVHWTRQLGTVLATTLIFVSGASFLSLLEAFH